MKSKGGSRTKAPYLTQGSVLDDLCFTSSEALEVKVKAEIYHELLRYIRERGFVQHDLGTLLGIHQPDVSNLLNGKISKFSVGKLIKFAGKLNLGAHITLTRPPAGKLPKVAGAATGKRRESSIA